MNRRGFLGALLATPATAVLPSAVEKFSRIAKIIDPAIPLSSIVGTPNRQVILNSAAYAKALWPGVAAWYAQAYRNMPNYTDLYK